MEEVSCPSGEFLLLLLKVKRYVHRRCGVGECADTDDVDTGLSDGGDGGFVDAAGGFGDGAAGDEVDGGFEGGEVHVVEEDDVGPGGEGLPDFVEVGRFDFDLHGVRDAGAGGV